MNIIQVKKEVAIGNTKWVLESVIEKDAQKKSNNVGYFRKLKGKAIHIGIVSDQFVPLEMPQYIGRGFHF